MTDYIELIIFALLGSVVSMSAGFLLLKKESSANKLAKYAMPFAAGALLAAVFIDLLPEGLEVGSTDTVLISVLVGLIVFFYLERFLTWFHRHEHIDSKKHSTKSLVIIGDTVHNALDGIVIASAFLIEPTGRCWCHYCRCRSRNTSRNW